MKRGADRAVYGKDQVKAILRAGLIAHVGVDTEQGPIVLPMAYTVRDDEVLIHGSVANAMMRAGASLDVCVTVTIVDALVVARTPFHNSMNYRSVVVRGTATPITETSDKIEALRAINDHLAPIWDTARPPSEIDLKKTMVLSVPLTEASAKVRGEDPIDEEQDLDGPHWAGLVPLHSTWGEATSAADLRNAADVPEAVRLMNGRQVHPPTG